MLMFNNCKWGIFKLIWFSLKITTEILEQTGQFNHESIIESRVIVEWVS